jgi:hypothetical protein
MGDFGCHAATGTAAPTAPAPESSELSFKESISTTGVDEQLSQLFMQSRTEKCAETDWRVWREAATPEGRSG